MTLTDFVGYLAMAGVLISFLMKNMRSLRITNSIGCALFIVYGCMLNFSLPLIVTNAAIIVINLIFLLRKS
jgi:hypothetical protein